MGTRKELPAREIRTGLPFLGAARTEIAEWSISSACKRRDIAREALPHYKVKKVLVHPAIKKNKNQPTNQKQRTEATKKVRPPKAFRKREGKALDLYYRGERRQKPRGRGELNRPRTLGQILGRSREPTEPRQRIAHVWGEGGKTTIRGGNENIYLIGEKKEKNHKRRERG